MFEELERAVLTVDIPDEGLVAGDIGTLVLAHPNGHAFEMEFISLDGHTVAVVTVEAAKLRRITDRDIPHAREMVTTA